MNNTNSYRNYAARARGFVALWAVPAMGLGLMTSRAEAAPFAYVTNAGSNTVSVIDTATNMVVATVVALFPLPPLLDVGVAVTPDGKHAYAVGEAVSVIDTATNMVVANVNPGGFAHGVAVTPDGKYAYVTVPSPPADVVVSATATNTVVAGIPVEPGPVDAFPTGVAITPDGKHAYVTNNGTNNVLEIDTTTNTAVGTPIPVGGNPGGVIVTPNGAHAYVANFTSNNVSVIATATNTVVATVPLPVGSNPGRVAVTPDGTHVYVANGGSNNVSVISTATNTVVATVTVGNGPTGVAVTPDGKHAYVTNNGTNNVSVISTATNTVVATVGVGIGPSAVGIVPPPAGVPFLTFSAKLAITFGAAPNQDSFNLHSPFTLSSTAPGLHPHRDPVTLQVGTFSITIPPGSFRQQPDGSFFFAGVINGVSLKAQIYHTGTLQYAFHAKAQGASLTGTMNPVYVTLIISGDSGATSVMSSILH